MKRIIYLTLCCLCASLLVSCDDFLLRDPKDRVTPESYFKTETDCELYTNEFYTMLPSASTLYSETADYIVKNILSDEVRGTRLVPSSSSMWSWNRLRDINFFLEHAHQCTDVKVREEYVGLARFFRAFFYFDKVRIYGDVPWVERTLSSEEEALYNGRDDRKVVFEKMLEDIDYAIAHLSSSKKLYRVTKWTALALKSRMCLFEGTFRKYHGLTGWQEILEAGAAASEEFILKSGYTLYNSGATPYKDLFASVTSKSSEIILTRAYSRSLGITHDVNGYFISTTMGNSGITKDVVNMYLMANGDRFTDKAGYRTMTFIQECDSRDPRLAQTIRTPGYVRYGSTVQVAPNMAATMSGYQIIKYVGEAKYDSYNSSENDMPIFRTAEVYLNHAESLAELGVLTQADLDKTINALRGRVGMPSLDMAKANADPDPYLMSPETGYVNVSGENTGVILEIRRERTIELICEGFRYWDIMRWKEGKRFERPLLGMYFPGAGEYDLDGNGTLDYVIYSGTKPEEQSGVVYVSLEEAALSERNSGNLTLHADIERHWNEDRDYLYPIPTDEITLTYGNIKQNPGWEQ